MIVQDLSARYGKPIIVLNLVKSAEKRPRESILQAELARAVAYINKGVRAFVTFVPNLNMRGSIGIYAILPL